MLLSKVFSPLINLFYQGSSNADESIGVPTLPKITATVESSKSFEDNNDESIEDFIASLDRQLTQAFGLTEKQDSKKSDSLVDIPSFCRHISTPAVAATATATTRQGFKRSSVNKRLLNAVHARKYDDTVYHTTHSDKRLMDVVGNDDADADDEFVIVPSDEPADVTEGDFIFLPKQVPGTLSPYYQDTKGTTTYGTGTIKTKFIEKLTPSFINKLLLAAQEQSNRAYNKKKKLEEIIKHKKKQLKTLWKMSLEAKTDLLYALSDTYQDDMTKENIAYQFQQGYYKLQGFWEQDIKGGWRCAMWFKDEIQACTDLHEQFPALALVQNICQPIIRTPILQLSFIGYQFFSEKLWKASCEYRCARALKNREMARQRLKLETIQEEWELQSISK